MYPPPMMQGVRLDENIGPSWIGEGSALTQADLLCAQAAS